jgi:hypothetical protein
MKQKLQVCPDICKCHPEGGERLPVLVKAIFKLVASTAARCFNVLVIDVLFVDKF